MSTKPSSNPTGSRRERRAAERRAASAKSQPTTAASTRRSPLLLITAVVGVVGIAVIAGAILLGGGGAQADTTDLRTPTTLPPTALADGRAIGKADAPVTLDVWTDFQCPVCGEFARIVEPQLIEQYVVPGTLRIVHHDAAFQGAKSSSSFDESVEAAAGAVCAADQGKYWPFQAWVFANQSGENKGAFADARLRAMATAAGLDVPAWDACRATGQAQAAVRAETRQATADGINATPTMKLAGETIVGLRSAAELGAMIQKAAGG